MNSALKTNGTSSVKPFWMVFQPLTELAESPPTLSLFLAHSKIAYGSSPTEACHKLLKVQVYVIVVIVQSLSHICLRPHGPQNTKPM